MRNKIWLIKRPERVGKMFVSLVKNYKKTVRYYRKSQKARFWLPIESNIKTDWFYFLYGQTVKTPSGQLYKSRGKLTDSPKKDTPSQVHEGEIGVELQNADAVRKSACLLESERECKMERRNQARESPELSAGRRNCPGKLHSRDYRIKTRD